MSFSIAAPGLTATQAVWFLIFAAPIAVFIAWSDMKYMRIWNAAVLALLAVFLVVGLFVLPFQTYLVRLVQMIVVLTLGIVLNARGMLGGGDAKYAAVIAAFVAFADLAMVLFLMSAMLLGAFVAHRALSRLPALRRLTPDWESWQRRDDFPMGLALSGTLLAYLALPLLFAR